MNKEELFVEYSKLSPNYQRILTKFYQDPIKFQKNKSWAQPFVDCITSLYPNISFTEAVFRVKKQIVDVPKCMHCDSVLPFILEPVHHYGKYCNNICSANHREQSKRNK